MEEYGDTEQSYFRSYEKAYQKAKEYALKEWASKETGKPEDYDENCHTWEELIDQELTEWKEIDQIVSICSAHFED